MNTDTQSQKTTTTHATLTQSDASTFFSLFRTHTFAIGITLVLLIVGSIGYVLFSPGVVLAKNPMSPAANALLLDESLQFKSTIGMVGEIKLFATVDDALLRKLRASEGVDSIAQASASRQDTYAPILIGLLEAQMMREEKLFTSVGDTLTDLFGMNVRIAGILAKTNTLVDDMHFVDSATFAQNSGTQGTVFVLPLEGMPKIFYTLPVTFDVNMSPKLPLAEGSLVEYKPQALGGVTYTPIIIGSAEAQMMREEGLFDAVGDTLRGFFGNNVVIVGVLEKTGTAIDMMHVLPLTVEQMQA